MTGTRHPYAAGPLTSDVPSLRRVAATALSAVLLAITAGSPIAVAPTWEYLAHYGFGDDHPWQDSSGRGHHLTPVGAPARHITRGAGHAVGFPAPCTGGHCPRLILSTPGTPALNPGTRPFGYGATIRLAATDTTDGQNIVQKGFSAEGSQYKLQIDGYAGHPSCVLRGTAGPTIHQAVADVTVADGRWHRLECRRAPRTLTMLVDGVARTVLPIPPALRVDNAMPLIIGGKSANPGNDQFHGETDDIFVRVPTAP